MFLLFWVFHNIQMCYTFQQTAHSGWRTTTQQQQQQRHTVTTPYWYSVTPPHWHICSTLPRTVFQLSSVRWRWSTTKRRTSFSVRLFKVHALLRHHHHLLYIRNTKSVRSSPSPSIRFTKEIRRWIWNVETGKIERIGVHIKILNAGHE